MSRFCKKHIGERSLGELVEKAKHGTENEKQNIRAEVRRRMKLGAVCKSLCWVPEDGSPCGVCGAEEQDLSAWNARRRKLYGGSYEQNPPGPVPE